MIVRNGVVLAMALYAESLEIMAGLAFKFLAFDLETMIKSKVKIMYRFDKIIACMAITAKGFGVMTRHACLTLLVRGRKLVGMVPIRGMHQLGHHGRLRMAIFAVSRRRNAIVTFETLLHRGISIRNCSALKEIDARVTDKTFL